LLQLSNEAANCFYNFSIKSFSLSPSGLLGINYEGKVVFANNEMLEILGLPARKVFGCNILSLFTRLYKKQGFLKTWEWLRHIYQPDAYLVTIQNNYGRMLNLKVTVLELADMGLLFIADHCDRPAGFSQIGNIIIEQLPIPVVSILSDGRISTLNQAFEDITHCRFLDFYGRPVAELEGLFPELPSKLLHTLYEAQPLCETIRMNRIKRPVFKLETRPITVWGEVRAVIACLHPLETTEIAQSSGPSSQNHKLISDLVEETAHRVRNPLTVVKGFIQLYKDDPKNIPWDLLLAEVSGIERTLQDLMVFSRNYRDKTERVNLNQIIADLFPAIEVTACQQGVWVELYLDRSLVNIKADSERIKALVNHLTASALHAMPEGGILTIRTMFDNDGVILQLTDNRVSGKDLLNGELEVSDDQENNGLGLTVCEHVVDSLGGCIQVTHTGNQYTIVTVTIPRNAG